MSCDCNNEVMGFDCVCDFVRKNPGDNEYCCEYCGLYTAGSSACNKCEKVEASE